jgi:hypothetical protein
MVASNQFGITRLVAMVLDAPVDQQPHEISPEEEKRYFCISLKGRNGGHTVILAEQWGVIAWDYAGPGVHPGDKAGRRKSPETSLIPRGHENNREQKRNA